MQQNSAATLPDIPDIL